MKKAALLLFGLTVVWPGRLPATGVSGRICGVLSDDKSPFRVTGDLVVPAGRKLVIRPGVVIRFEKQGRIMVEGSLVCRGDIFNAIKFTAVADSHPGSWDGIYFTAPESKGTLINCVIQYSTVGIYCQSASQVTIDNNILAGNSLYGVYCVGGAGPLIINNLITDSNYGIVCYEGSAPRIRDNTIRQTVLAGIYCFDRSGPVIVGNVITGVSGPGIHCLAACEPVVEGNLVSACRNGIQCTDASPAITGNSIHDNVACGIACFGSAPIILHNNIYNHGLYDIQAVGPDSVSALENWWGFRPVTTVRNDQGQLIPRLSRARIFGPVRTCQFLLSPYDILLEQPKAIASLEFYAPDHKAACRRAAPGQDILVKVVGIDGSSTTRDRTTVAVYEPRSPTASQQLPLEETDINTGVYQGIFTLEPGLCGQALMLGQKNCQYLTVIPQGDRDRQQRLDIVNAPPAVAGFKVGTVGDGRISVKGPVRFAWDYRDPGPVAQPQTRFQLQVSDSDRFPSRQCLVDHQGTGPTACLAVPGHTFRPGREYHARVRVRDRQQWSAWDTITFTANTPPPAPNPVFPKPDMVLAGGLWPSLVSAITRDADDDRLEYFFEIYRDEKMRVLVDSGQGIQKAVYQAWQSLKRLEENGSYWWRVGTRDGYENSPWSPPQHFSLNLVDEPIAPFALRYPSAQALVPCQNVVFTWEATADPDPGCRTTYTLWLSTDPEFKQRIEVNGLTVNHYEPEFPLNFGATYYWKVIAVAGTDNYRWCNTSHTPHFSFSIHSGQVAAGE